MLFALIFAVFKLATAQQHEQIDQLEKEERCLSKKKGYQYGNPLYDLGLPVIQRMNCFEEKEASDNMDSVIRRYTEKKVE